MRYLFLIYGDEKKWDFSPQAMVPWAAFNEEVADKNQASAALEETSTAKTVRIRDGQGLTADGPFAETKEQLGGFYLLDCKDMDEAIEIAAKIPAAANGSIEVRPIMEMQP